ncbi:hypothetical protein B6A42_20835 [Vibrio coralliilyticus]|nr:hypothetical protein B6A42_20835 [Vibrio coralliilyticus]
MLSATQWMLWIYFLLNFKIPMLWTLSIMENQYFLEHVKKYQSHFLPILEQAFNNKLFITLRISKLWSDHG